MIRNFSKFNGKSNPTESDKIRYIHSVINDEAKKTKDMGLKISKDDIDLERKKITPIIYIYWDKIESSDIREYSKLRNVLSSIIFDRLEDKVKFYFDLSKSEKLDVFNKYNCHLSAIIDRLFMEISNKKVIYK